MHSKYLSVFMDKIISNRLVLIRCEDGGDIRCLFRRYN